MSQIGPSNLLSQQLHGEKYRADGETFDDYSVRYSRTTADSDAHFHRLLEMTRQQRLLPAGRQQRAVGTPHRITAFNCLGRETPVTTREYGIVPISDILGQTVHVVNRDGVWSPVIFKSYGIQPLRTLQLRCNEEELLHTIRATDGHRWVSASGIDFTTAELLKDDAEARGLFKLAAVAPREIAPILHRWKIVSIGQETDEDEVYCCIEKYTHTFAILGSCLTGNCFVADTVKDDMTSIMRALEHGASTMRAGGGKGWDFSTLRPEGDRVNGLGDGAYASGPVSFMSMWDSMCRTIMSGGGRRGKACFN